MSYVESAHDSVETITPESSASQRIADFIRQREEHDSSSREPRNSEFWQRINATTTSLWLDSGDVDSIDSLWCQQFSGVTTNNTLLNNEVQNGAYDELVPQISKLVGNVPDDVKVREIGFALNLCHALKLVQQFSCNVSVELHTDVAHDSEATMAYARRCHDLCPEFFIVKIPFTPSGLIAINQLRDEGIRVNCTLGFSARQNYVATALSRPSFVNVFLGRLNSYIADNHLGDGQGVGEKATLASQAEVSTFTRGLPTTDTQQIAASLRDASQLPKLAGVDVITIPTKVAKQAEPSLDQPWQSQLNHSPTVKLGDQIDPSTVRIEKLWDVSKSERNFVQKAILLPPASAVELKQMAADHQIEDLFPEMASEEKQAIAEDGKIPNHRRWQQRIVRGDLAIDSLMTLAGLATFAKSQSELDQRIRKQLR
tara:strand:+ start:6474 stop:7754 length:1281 start_codon:yes stop_codon:yes gene_type:complete